MHKTTREALATLARWTAETAAMDEYALAMQKVVDAVEVETLADDDRTLWASIDCGFGDLTVHVRDGREVSDAKPFLRRARELGFTRDGDPKQNAADGTLTWTYLRKYDDDDTADWRRQKLVVQLTLPKQDDDTADTGCRYVTVGMKEVPDVQLLCGEELAAWNEAQAVPNSGQTIGEW